jgi:hypothetical protein
MLLLVRSDEEWEALDDEARDYGAIMAFWGRLAASGRLLEGYELQPARTARTVSRDSERVVVTDGPFMEAKETIGGYGIVEVPDLEAAVEIARDWPARAHRVEIRPLTDRDGHQDRT